jgi:hypothetical protein
MSPDIPLDYHRLRTPIDHPDSSVTTEKLASLDYITLKSLTANPTLVAGRLWYRGDLNRIMYSPDGVNVISIDPRLTLLASDETELSTTSTSYTSLKQFNMVKNSALGLNWRSLRIIAECYISTSGATATLGVYIGGTLMLEIGWTETSYTLKTGTIDISGLADGKYLVDFRMKVTSGTGYFRLLEVWAS